jgi:copper chaperone
MINTYTVNGMTCGHCVASVTEEVSAIPGVTNVSIDLESGLVTVDSNEALEADAFRAAVEEAGYTVA